MKGRGWIAAALAAAGMSVWGAAPASAQSCADLVEHFAADHSLSTSPPPTAVPSTPGTAGSTTGTTGEDGSGTGAASSEKLARSGGVVAPPAVGDTAVIEPPRAGSSNMPTAPAVRPDAGPGTSGSTGDAMAPAAQNAQMEALVTAARTAAKNGDEAQCMESLSLARSLSRTAPTGPGGGG